jgi:hypothetical protein
MKTLILIAVAMMSATLAACGPAGKTIGKTTTGQRTYNTEWQRIEPKRVLINIGDLGNVEVTRTEERLRDNSIIQQGVNFAGFGRIYVEHLTGPYSVYNTGVTDRHNDASKLVSRYYKSKSRYDIQTADPEKGRIRKFGDRGGWVGSATEIGTGKTCIVGRVAFLSRATKNRAADERYDTVVQFRDCSGRRSLEEVKEFLKGVRIVSRA